MDEINILYCIDECNNDYSRYLGVSIFSLLENNKDENIHIYILSKHIEKNNKEEIIRIVKLFGKKISFSPEGKDIVPENFKRILDPEKRWPLATYYRWFFNDFFDIKDRLLYLDCDTIVLKNLSDFYNQNFEGNIYVGNLDVTTDVEYNKKLYGLKNYINAGVYLLNVEPFLECNLFEEVYKVKQKYGTINCVDQGYINIIFQDKIKIYNNLQCIIGSLWGDYDLNKYLILHTIKKPNEGGFGYCPRKIEKIFNNYLSKTHRKHYIKYKRKISIKYFLGWIFTIINSLIEYLILKLFGGNCAFYYKKNICQPIGMFLGKILGRLGL